MKLNEFDQALKEFIEEIVKNVLGRYCAETNNQIELLATALNTLMSILINARFPNTEELKAVMDKALEDKVSEIRAKNLGEKSEVQESAKSAKPDS